MLEVNKALCENHNKLYGGKNMFYEPEKNDHGLGRAPFKSCVVPRAIGWLSTISEDGVIGGKLSAGTYTFTVECLVDGWIGLTSEINQTNKEHIAVNAVRKVSTIVVKITVS